MNRLIDRLFDELQYLESLVQKEQGPHNHEALLEKLIDQKMAGLVANE